MMLTRKIVYWRDLPITVMSLADIDRKSKRRLMPKIREHLAGLQGIMDAAGVTETDQWLLLILRQGSQSNCFGVAFVRRRNILRHTAVRGFIFDEAWSWLREVAKLETDRLCKNEIQPILVELLVHAVNHPPNMQEAGVLPRVTFPQFPSQSLHVVSDTNDMSTQQ